MLETALKKSKIDSNTTTTTTTGTGSITVWISSNESTSQELDELGKSIQIEQLISNSNGSSGRFNHHMLNGSGAQFNSMFDGIPKSPDKSNHDSKLKKKKVNIGVSNSNRVLDRWISSREEMDEDVGNNEDLRNANSNYFHNITKPIVFIRPNSVLRLWIPT
ncbi:hypothetical protein ACTFIU_011281 [Dictyostelium citrinum]